MAVEYRTVMMEATLSEEQLNSMGDGNWKLVGLIKGVPSPHGSDTKYWQYIFMRDVIKP